MGTPHIASMMYDAPMAMAVTLRRQQERADGAYAGATTADNHGAADHCPVR